MEDDMSATGLDVIRQDVADHQHLARRDHGKTRARPTGSLACSERRPARVAGPPPYRTGGPSRCAIAAVGPGALLRPVASRRANAQRTLGGTVPGPCLGTAGRYTPGERARRHAGYVPGAQPPPRSAPGREGPAGVAGEHPRFMADRGRGTTLRTCRLRRLAR